VTTSVISVVPVILCGGSGTRLWPLSRAGFPKQFLAITGSESLFQLAARRLQALSNPSINMKASLVVTNEEHRFLALEQLRELGSAASLILEPCARNTAAALTLAALQARQDSQIDNSDPVMVASPADQYIGDDSAYKRCLQRGITLAASGSIVILGIKPDRPETGYGYIQYAYNLQDTDDSHHVVKFVEKPSLELANAYLASGDFAWNSGMFILKASVWLDALAYYRPDILHTCQAAFEASIRDELATFTSKQTEPRYAFIRPDATLFAQVPAESVDYAVMEKCPKSPFRLEMLSLSAGWSDMGAWDAVWQVGKADLQGNVCQGDVLLDSSRNTYIHASHRLVAAVGVSDLVIVETADAVLVSDKSQSQNVKKIVLQLDKSDRHEQSLHRKVHRPWGWYDSIDEGERFKVKRIMVKAGAALSLQKHSFRAEHWIVVKGTAEVTCGEQVMTLTENQSTYIPLGTVHRLRNNTDAELEIIEVQSGDYLGEDDIVRLQDTYGRP
jgi:mannose-1-phosphate guanylyltransferase / mannose-6-phosphate isomerase